MKPGVCCRKACESPPDAKDDLFCPEHWKGLPRWARVELVQRRNAARRGGKAATTDYVKALMVAASLTA